MSELSIKDFVDLVSKRPGMYVGSEGITELNGLLNGFCYSRDSSEDIDVIRAFSLWLIREKYPMFIDYNTSWYSLLRFDYANEKRAMDKFFELWLEFVESNAK